MSLLLPTARRPDLRPVSHSRPGRCCQQHHLSRWLQEPRAWRGGQANHKAVCTGKHVTFCSYSLFWVHASEGAKQPLLEASRGSSWSSQTTRGGRPNLPMSRKGRTSQGHAHTVWPAASGQRNSELDGEVTQTSSVMGDKAEGACGCITACRLHSGDGDTHSAPGPIFTNHSS